MLASANLAGEERAPGCLVCRHTILLVDRLGGLRRRLPELYCFVCYTECLALYVTALCRRPRQPSL